MSFPACSRDFVGKSGRFFQPDLVPGNWVYIGSDTPTTKQHGTAKVDWCVFTLAGRRYVSNVYQYGDEEPIVNGHEPEGEPGRWCEPWRVGCQRLLREHDASNM